MTDVEPNIDDMNEDIFVKDKIEVSAGTILIRSYSVFFGEELCNGILENISSTYSKLRLKE